MKVQVLMSEEMVERVDYYAKKMGVSRSAFCSMSIGNAIMSYDKSMDILSLIGDKIGDSLLAEKTLLEVANAEKKK